MNNNKCFIYKNDLKFNENFDFDKSEFESDVVKDIYNSYKGKPKIELRIEDSKMENYRFLDLSKLEITDDILKQILSLKRIKDILKKIEFLDLSNNKIREKPNLEEYNNIKYLSLSFNEIEGTIIDNNLIELTCHDNKIEEITSSTIKKLNASNNKIRSLDVINIEVLIINSNRLDYIESYLNLKYLECIENKIGKINNMINLEELYIANNKLDKISNMPKMVLLNCIDNPIKKIGYIDTLKILFTSIPTVSSKYKISNISKIKNYYLINFKK